MGELESCREAQAYNKFNNKKRAKKVGKNLFSFLGLYSPKKFNFVTELN